MSPPPDAARALLAHLSEGQVVDDVPLTRDEAVALGATRLVDVSPSGRGWQVRAAFRVGAVRTDDLLVRVNPKVGLVQVLRLLARSLDLSGLQIDDSAVDAAAEHELTAVLATLFVREARTAMADGPLRGYRGEDQTLPVVRGRIRLREQELRRYGLLVPLEVTVDEWTTDTDENRRLRAACRRLLAVGGLDRPLRSGLLRLDRMLADVTLPPAGTPLAPWVRTRLNVRLHRLLSLADLVLAQTGVEHRVGNVRVHGYVLDLAILFERLVTVLLRETGRADGIDVRKRRLHLDADRRLFIEPDLVLSHGSEVQAVADTKYKLLDEHGKFPNADAYQLVTYCARLGLDTGHLVYAAGDPRPELYVIQGAGTRLHVHSLDLEQPLERIEADVARLYRTITASESAVAGPA